MSGWKSLSVLGSDLLESTTGIAPYDLFFSIFLLLFLIGLVCLVIKGISFLKNLNSRVQDVDEKLDALMIAKGEADINANVEANIESVDIEAADLDARSKRGGLKK